MLNQRSVVIGVILGLTAVVALSLSVIASLNPIKVSLPTTSLLKFPPSTVSTTPEASPSPGWEVPQASSAAGELFLVIIDPSNNLVTTSQQIRLNGQTAITAKLSFNEQALPLNPDGSFSTLINLAPGENEIVIAARNNQGKENIQTALVLVAPEEDGKKLEIKSAVGIVGSITGSNYQFVTEQGVQTEFEVNPLTRYLRKYGGIITKEEILPGHVLEAVTVGQEALLIRDLSLKENGLWK